ncbi:MAG: glycosyl transferase family 1 [Rhodospirillaceae bacterium]|nr:glycosyl transferase family 1 [Rhodospirillaceae bacterium]
MRLLTYTTLWPNSIQPTHGVFVENRLRHLVAAGVETRIVAPVPWFPSSAGLFGSYAAFAAVPPAEERNGFEVHHPRYVVVPKIGMTLTPYTLYRASIAPVRALIGAGYDFDAIDAHYFYPDGVAAALLGRLLDKPVVITARGTDLNLIPQYRLPRRMIRFAASRAAALITVCQALKDSLIELGIPASKVTVLRNGVDLAGFRPLDRQEARAALGFDRPTLVSVGGLITRKGHDITIRALKALPDFALVIAGDGPERGALEALAKREGVGDRVRFMGRVPHGELAPLYSAADASVLASSREGWANVLLESMACGTPVIASNVWGTPEVVATPAAGVLMADRTPAALADAVRALFAALPSREATRAYAEGFSWDDTTRGQIDLFRSVIAGHGGDAHVPSVTTPGELA